jgi:hypothetical protein
VYRTHRYSAELAELGPKSKKAIMPQRPSIIPTHLERSALQRLSAREWDVEQNLRPDGPNAITTMPEKGWIERLPDASRKPIDAIVMFRMLVLQSLYNLSDDRLSIRWATACRSRGL